MAHLKKKKMLPHHPYIEKGRWSKHVIYILQHIVSFLHAALFQAFNGHGLRFAIVLAFIPIVVMAPAIKKNAGVACRFWICSQITFL